MRSAIGFLIILYGLSHFFGQSMRELDTAATASFKTLTVAAEVTSAKLKQ